MFTSYNCSSNLYYDRFEDEYKVNNRRAVYNYWTAPTEEEKQMREETLAQVQAYKEFVAEQKADLAKRKAEVKKHNDKIKKQYASKINKLKAQLRKLEKERDSQLLENPKLEKDAWAKKGM